MSFSRAEIVDLCKQSLANAAIGTGPDELQNGKDFYKFMFENFPDLRVYPGAEHFTPDDVQNSQRFERQGQRILLGVNILVHTFDSSDMTFRAYARETMNFHRQFKLDPSLWKAFFNILIGYLETKITVTDAMAKAWTELGKVFSDESLDHLKNLGLPH